MFNVSKFLLFLFVSSMAFSETRVVVYSYGTNPNSSLEDYSKITHIVGSFINSDSLGNLSFLDWIPEDDLLAVLEKAKGHDVVPMIALGTTVGGWEMTKSASARANFISNIIAYCSQHGIKGIDLDLEGTAEEFNWGNPGTFFPEPYESLAVELRAAMPDSMILTAAIGSHSRNGAQWTDGFLNTLDWVNIMIYDRYLSWETSPVKNHSTFEGQVEAADYWHKTRGISKDRISLGVPFYARGWDRDNNRIYRENPGWDVTTWGYKYFIDKYDISLDQDTMNLAADDTVRYARASGVTGKATLFFNSPVMIAKKTQWALDSGYGGMMVWHFDQDVPTSDERSLLRAMDSVISGSTASKSFYQNKKDDICFFNTNKKIKFIGLQKNVNYNLTVYSLKGQTLFSSRFKTSSSSIELSSKNLKLSKGSYMISLKSENIEFSRMIISK